MIVASDRDAEQVVLEFCNLQHRLVGRFLQDVCPKDLERFSDVERIGTLRIGSQEWKYTRHGAGILFEIPGAVVDAHIGLALFPNAIDGWRLLQYLESIGVSSVAFDGAAVAANDEEGLERLLEKMEHAGILEAAYLQPPTRVFFPRSLSLH